MPIPHPPNLATPFALGTAAPRPFQLLRVWTKFGGAWNKHRWGQPTNQHQPFCSLPLFHFGLQSMFFVSWTQHGFGCDSTRLAGLNTVINMLLNCFCKNFSNYSGVVFENSTTNWPKIQRVFSI